MILHDLFDIIPSLIIDLLLEHEMSVVRHDNKSRFFELENFYHGVSDCIRIVSDETRVWLFFVELKFSGCIDVRARKNVQKMSKFSE